MSSIIRTVIMNSRAATTVMSEEYMACMAFVSLAALLTFTARSEYSPLSLSA